MHILQCMGSTFCVKLQRAPLKFFIKFLTHTLQIMHFTNWPGIFDLQYLWIVTSQVWAPDFKVTHLGIIDKFSKIMGRGNRESIMGVRAEQSSPEWVCIPKITSNSEWFLQNANSWGWTQFHMDVHDQLYFFLHFISCDNFTKTPEITVKSSEIMVRSWKSQLIVEESIFCPFEAEIHTKNIFYFTIWTIQHYIDFGIDKRTFTHCPFPFPSLTDLNHGSLPVT